jgi:hypothetical protein
MNNRIIASITGASLLAIAGAAFVFKATISASLYFPSEKFKTLSVDKRDGVVVVAKELPLKYMRANPMIYRDCPYDDNKIWEYQTADTIKVEFYIGDVLITATDCPRDWTLLKSGAALLNN